MPLKPVSSILRKKRNCRRATTTMVTAISLDHPRPHNQAANNHHNHGVVVEEIQGLIKIYGDGHVERFPIVPNVTPAVPPELCVTARDVIIHRPTNTWARFYVPTQQTTKLPLVVYFHGGGFCVGSAAWKCYHDFLVGLASKAGCVIMSVNYRLAPENRLPAAYDDGVNAVSWVKQQALSGSREHQWWLTQCNLSSFFLAGDSAGANIAHHVAAIVATQNGASLRPLCLKGIVLIQPFLGGETRTDSEKHLIQAYNSALSLSVSDAYWRLSLPLGANRDHPWCNPLAKTAPRLSDLRQLPPLMVCISEMDILKDRNLEFCAALACSGAKVEKVMYKGVGHAFQILHNYPLSQQRTLEMMSHLRAFIHS